MAGLQKKKKKKKQRSHKRKTTTGNAFSTRSSYLFADQSVAIAILECGGSFISSKMITTEVALGYLSLLAAREM